MRIVVVTAHDSRASVILVPRDGGDDYLPKPVGEGELVDALPGRSPGLPPVPETPLRIERVGWEGTVKLAGSALRWGGRAGKRPAWSDARSPSTPATAFRLR
jgi:hypothetical protein